MRDSLICPVVAAMLLFSAPAMATDIKEKEYGYGYGDTVKAMPKDAFVVCDDCKTDKLGKAPWDFVAIKYNPPAMRDNEPVEDYSADPETFEQEHKSPRQIEPTLTGTVLFQFDSAKLKKSAKEKLDRIVASTPAGADLTVSGYACTTGKQKYNKKLSERRAKTVAAYLKSKGAEIKAVEGKGECCERSKTNKTLNRRVEVTKKEKK